MWTQEIIDKWRIRRMEIDIDQEFRTAAPEVIAEVRESLIPEEQIRFDAYLLKLKTEHEYYLKLYEDGKREQLEKTAEYKRRTALNKKFKIERTLQKLIKKCQITFKR